MLNDKGVLSVEVEVEVVDLEEEVVDVAVAEEDLVVVVVVVVAVVVQPEKGIGFVMTLIVEILTLPGEIHVTDAM